MAATQPNWILDRRDSGIWYWRRDGRSPVSNQKPSKQVKFRCEVEVREFLRSDYENKEDPTEDLAAPSAAFVLTLGLCFFAASFSYNWWFVS